MAGKPAEETPTDWQFTEVSTQAFASGVARTDEVLPTGTELGDYIVDRVIGKGGGGIVYAATHRVLGRRVAVKVLRAEMAAHPKMITRFVQEAVAVNKIGHPNIVDIFEFKELEPGRPYYVMELLDGIDLRRALELHGRYTAAEVFELLEPIFHAVTAAHQAGFLHRDLKANNIVIVEGAAGRTVKLLDFGIAKMLGDESTVGGLTEPGAVIGTAHNMAPEQVRGERPDERADVYALGVLMYQLLTGHYPFEGDDARQVALMHLQMPPPRPSSLAPLAPAVEAVVLRCLAKKPEHRYASVPELLEAFRTALSDAPAQAEGTRSALGALFELVTGDDEPDDALLEDMDQVFELLEPALVERGFALPLRTASSLLAVQLLDSVHDTQGEHAGEEALREVRALIEARAGAHPGLQINISLQVGTVSCRASASGLEIVGGPLLKTFSWRAPGKL